MSTTTAEPAGSSVPEAAGEAPAEKFLTRVFLTGATGFVGRHVLRELVARGHKAVCLVRDQQRIDPMVRRASGDRVEAAVGDLFDADAMARGLEGAEAVIHLVGIISESRLRGQTFERIHVEGTQRVVEAAKAAGVRRMVHMSALGTRPGAVSQYHRTKWAAESVVRGSGLDWTIFRPSLIHGPEGEFIRMMRVFACDPIIPVLGFIPSPFPVMPYFGTGQTRIQPVSVKDVAECFVKSLSMPETIGKTFDLGGPEAMTWQELYRTCAALIPGAKRWKKPASVPVPVAKALAITLMKTPLLPRMLRFNIDQVQMSQEDSVCDAGAVEKAFDIRLRDFRAELASYADRIE